MFPAPSNTFPRGCCHLAALSSTLQVLWHAYEAALGRIYQCALPAAAGVPPSATLTVLCRMYRSSACCVDAGAHQALPSPPIEPPGAPPPPSPSHPASQGLTRAGRTPSPPCVQFSGQGPGLVTLYLPFPHFPPPQPLQVKSEGVSKLGSSFSVNH